MIPKTKRALLTASLWILLSSAEVMGGNIGGGSGPPAKEQLLQLLISQSLQNAGLFAQENGDLNLGVNSSLDSELLLSTTGENALRISASDFDKISNLSPGTIDATSLGDQSNEPSTRSYRIDDGSKLGELILKDRREIARKSLK